MTYVSFVGRCMLGTYSDYLMEHGEATRATELWKTYENHTAAGMGVFDEERMLLMKGDRVRIMNLNSEKGIALNGHLGTVWKFNVTNARVGVEVDGMDGVMAIRDVNLHWVPFGGEQSDGNLFPNALDHFGAEELNEQAAIEASLESGAGAPQQGEFDVNAQLSGALLGSRSRAHIALHTFSPCPQALFEALSDDPELAAYDRALEGHMRTVTTRARVRVKPEHFEPLVEALRLSGFPLSGFQGSHMFSEPLLNETIANIVDRLPGTLKVSVKLSGVVPLEFAAAALDNNVGPAVFKTFINIRVPTSLCSSEAIGPHTASTTEARDRVRSHGQRPCGKSRPEVCDSD